MGLASSQRHENVVTLCAHLHSVSATHRYIAGSLTFFSVKAVSAWVLAYRHVSVFENNVLDASLDLYNHQNKSFDGYTGKRCIQDIIHFSVSLL